MHIEISLEGHADVAGAHEVLVTAGARSVRIDRHSLRITARIGRDTSLDHIVRGLARRGISTVGIYLPGRPLRA